MKAKIKTNMNKKTIKKVAAELENKFNKEFLSKGDSAILMKESMQILGLLKFKYLEEESYQLRISHERLRLSINGWDYMIEDVLNDLKRNQFITNNSYAEMIGITVFLLDKSIQYFKGNLKLDETKSNMTQTITNNIYGNYNQIGDYCSMEIHNNDDAINVIDKMLLLTKENNDIYQKIKELKEAAKKDNKVKALEIITNIVSVIIAMPTLYNMLNPYITLLIQFFNA